MTLTATALAARSRLERLEGDVRLVLEGSVDPDDVALAEELLGARLPPAYVDLVTQLGPFKLAESWDAKSRAFELLSPARVVEETERFRSLARTIDAELHAMAEQFALLQFASTPVDFYVLRLANGTVHLNVHDDGFSWGRGASFEEHVQTVLVQIEQLVE